MTFNVPPTKLILSVGSLTLLSSVALADVNFAIGPKIGTLGAGVEAVVGSGEAFNLRINANGWRYSREIHKDTVKWNGKLNLKTAGIFADYHPFENGFRISAGPLLNYNSLNISAAPNQNLTINGHTYTPTQIGKATGKLKFKKVSPYLGIGYESAFTNNSCLSMNVEAGVLFQGKAKGTFSATGSSATQSQFLNDLKSNAEKAANKDFIRYYPVISIGFKYRF